LTNTRDRGCQMFLGTWYQNRKNVPNEYKMYQMVLNIPNFHRIFQTATKYLNFFLSKALQNLPKSGFLVWKQTIWQPCSQEEKKFRCMGGGGRNRARRQRNELYVPGFEHQPVFAYIWTYVGQALGIDPFLFLVLSRTWRVPSSGLKHVVQIKCEKIWDRCYDFLKYFRRKI
jgi:hypothetical protein